MNRIAYLLFLFQACSVTFCDKINNNVINKNRLKKQCVFNDLNKVELDIKKYSNNPSKFKYIYPLVVNQDFEDDFELFVDNSFCLFMSENYKKIAFKQSNTYYKLVNFEVEEENKNYYSLCKNINTLTFIDNDDCIVNQLLTFPLTTTTSKKSTTSTSSTSTTSTTTPPVVSTTTTTSQNSTTTPPVVSTTTTTSQNSTTTPPVVSTTTTTSQNSTTTPPVVSTTTTTSQNSTTTTQVVSTTTTTSQNLLNFTANSSESTQNVNNNNNNLNNIIISTSLIGGILIISIAIIAYKKRNNKNQNEKQTIFVNDIYETNKIINTNSTQNNDEENVYYNNVNTNEFMDEEEYEEPVNFKEEVIEYANPYLKVEPANNIIEEEVENYEIPIPINVEEVEKNEKEDEELEKNMENKVRRYTDLHDHINDFASNNKINIV